MVTLDDIQAQTGISINIIQYWRRQQHEGLLPEPVAVKKKVIYFDDSIIERIRFIEARLNDGLKLPEIKKLLQQKDEEELAARYDPNETYDDDPGRLIDAAAELVKNWAHGDRKNDVCLALALDPAISGPPALSVISVVGSFAAPVEVSAAIVSNGWVHFAVLHVHLGEETNVKVVNRAKIKTADYGMLLAIMGRQFAEANLLLTPNDIPGLLFGGYDTIAQPGVFGLETLEEAKKLTRVLRAGQEFIKHL